MNTERHRPGGDLRGLGPEHKAGLSDFWQAYEANYDKITADLLLFCEKLPGLAAAIKSMSQAQLDDQSLRSKELLRSAILEGNWQPLIADNRSQGANYAAMGVAFREWFELVGAFQKMVIPHLVTTHSKSSDRLTAAIVGMNAYLDLSMSVIGEEYLRTKERIITQQQEAIQELSTPVLQVRERLLLIPIVGVLDTQRARHLTQHLLLAIRTHRAKVVVLDITGVPAVDSKVANHLLQTVRAARLMGARSVVTGLSAEVAQALVVLGVDIEQFNTVGDLQGGLEEAEHLLRARETGSSGANETEAT